MGTSKSSNIVKDYSNFIYVGGLLDLTQWIKIFNEKLITLNVINHLLTSNYELNYYYRKSSIDNYLLLSGYLIFLSN